MANIDELHWSAILDTKDFDKAVAKLRNDAQRLNTDLSKMLNIYEKFRGKTIITDTGVKNAKELSRTLTEISKQVEGLPQGITLFQSATERANKEVERTSDHYTKQSGLLRQLKSLAGAYFSVRGVQSFLKSLIDVTGQFEVQKMALTSMLQSSEIADKIFNQYRQLALESPYTFQDFTKFGKQLTAFNIPAKELVGTTKMLADVAAGLGVDMGRVILAYGQIKSAGVLKGTELRQLTEAGVPILESLAKQIEETTGKAVKLSDIFSMISKKQIPFEMVEKAFREMTSEGGKFYNMQEVLVETLKGKIGKLRDVWQQMLYDMGRSEDVNPLLKNSIDYVTKLISDYETFGRRIAEIVVAFGIYKTALIALEVTTGTFTAANHKLIGSLTSIAKYLYANPYVALAAAIAGVAYAVYRWSTALTNAEKVQKATNDALLDANAAAAKEISSLDTLYAKLEMATKGTDDYARAKQDIYDKYGGYIAQLKSEGVAVDNLADIYDKLKTKIEDAARARALDSAIARIEKTRDDAYDAIESKMRGTGVFDNTVFRDFFLYKGRKDPTAKQQQYIQSYIMGGVSLDRLREIAKESNEAQQVVEYIEGAQKRTASTERRMIETLRKDWADVTQAAKDGVQDVRTAVDELYSVITNEDGPVDSPQPMLDWQKKVMESLTGAGDNASLKDLKFAATENWQNYRNRIGEEYKKMVAGLQSEVEETDYQYYKDRVAFIKELDEKFGGKLLIGFNANGGGNKKSAPKFDINWDGIVESVDKELMKTIDDDTKQFEKDFEDRMKALSDFDAFIEKWAQTSVEHNGEGVSNKVGSLIGDYKKADYNVLVDYRKQLTNLKTAFGENTEAYSNAKKKLDEWKKSMEAANKSDFYEKIKSLADDIFKEGMQGFDLTNWNDKTIGQIESIEQALDKLDIPDEIKEALKNYPEILELLRQKVEEIVNETEENTVDPEKMKAIKREAVFAIKKIVGLSDSFAQLGEAMGDAGLQDAATAISDISSAAGEAINAFNQFGGKGGGGAAAFAAYLVIIIEMEKKLLQLTAIDEAQRRREAQAQRDARNTGRLQDTETGSFFGTSQVKLMNSRIRQIQRIRESMAGYVDDVENMAFRVNHFKWWQKMFGWMNGENYSQVNGKTKLLPDTSKSIQEIAEKLGLRLYDDYNNLDAETLKAILSSYEDLTDAEKSWIQQAIADSESYAEAMKDIQDILDDVFGDIASDAADTIIDKWIEAGDAALDYADILDDVAKRYAKMLIESSILDQILNKDEADKVASMFINGDAEGAMERIAEDMQRIADMEPLYESILSAFDPYFSHQSGGGTTLADGIKGITEDTAGLLASYLNAIRADVSYMRMMEESGWRDVNAISIVMPTLNDYLAQVAATNANIAESNRQILERIDRLTTTSSGRAALAVDVQ